MPDIYTSHTLQKVVDGLDRPQAFLLDAFFPELALFDTEKIDFDILDRAQGLAPFVAPMVQGKPVNTRGYQTKSFTPAYLKPKDAIKPNRPLRRRPGERIGADQLTPGARRDAIITETLEDQRNSIIRRKEWMASQVLSTGSVVVSGEDYPEVTVDFGRDPSLTTVLAGAARWGQSGVSIIQSLEDEGSKVASLSGAVVTDIVLSPGAWNLARTDAELLAMLDNRRQDGGQIQLGPTTGGEDMWARFLGTVGQFNFWLYQQPYTDDDGNAQDMMPTNGVMCVSSQIMGYQGHGAILDPESDYLPAELWPKQWIEKDPPVEFVMTQSAPLVIPARPNASSFLQVA